MKTIYTCAICIGLGLGVCVVSFGAEPQNAHQRKTLTYADTVVELTTKLKKLKDSDYRRWLATELDDLRKNENKPDLLQDFKRYRALVQTYASDREISFCELRLICAAVFAYAEGHDSRLPGTLDELGLPKEVAVQEYLYFPVPKSSDLDGSLILITAKTILKIGDGKVVWLEDRDNHFWSMDIDSYKKFREEKHTGQSMLASAMRDYVPELYVIVGDGQLSRLQKSTYGNLLKMDGETRKRLGQTQIPGQLYDDIFKDVDESIYSVPPKDDFFKHLKDN